MAGEKAKKERKPSFISRWWEGMGEQRRGAIVKGYFFIIIALIVAGGVAYIMRNMEHKVMADRTGPVPTAVRVTLADTPPWLAWPLAHQIPQSLVPRDMSPTDPDLPQRVFELAQANPWIKKVHSASRRIGGDPRTVVIEVKADYRMPVAMAVPQSGGPAEYVDAEGIRLPADQVARCFVNVPATKDKPAHQVFFMRRSDIPAGWKVWGIHYIMIEGVAAPPPAVGKKWDSPDLFEGLKMIGIICTRKDEYAGQIQAVDMRNFRGRNNPGQSHICLRAKVGNGPETIIKFGRLPDSGGDCEVPTEVKMRRLDTFVSDQNGQLAGTAAYIDLRNDYLSYRPN
ncbi:MAG: hypothetical protein ACE15C_16355 [Phycisphaerae bacterium]